MLIYYMQIIFYYFLLFITLFLILLHFQINLFNFNKNITLIDKLSSMCSYILPLLEGLQNFGQQVLPDYPLSLIYIYKKICMPLVIFYITNPLLIFTIFFILYYLFIRSKSPIPNRPFIRFNVLQAILLFLINSLLGSVFRSLPIALRVNLYGLILCNILFWFVLTTVIYSAIESFKGQYTKIPVISQAVKIQIENF
uniref:Tic20 family protein Ycf60 n=1 Tax=Choreocolax polysiphoniae TaxID=282351 RepID=A0A0B5W5G9_9FLOR|nr:hypothetical protein [Choreocolax polysiphoniae]AJH65836.1 hypothetical protein [Choreocolax polysiphoniae]